MSKRWRELAGATDERLRKERGRLRRGLELAVLLLAGILALCAWQQGRIEQLLREQTSIAARVASLVAAGEAQRPGRPRPGAPR